MVIVVWPPLYALQLVLSLLVGGGSTFVATHVRLQLVVGTCSCAHTCCVGSSPFPALQIDGCWYRARLQSPGKEDRWNVLFVDYGDVGTCPASELKEMK